MSEPEIEVCEFYGVNPCMIKCMACNESSSIALLGRLTKYKVQEMFGKDALDTLNHRISASGTAYYEAPRMISGSELCNSCIEKNKTMVLFIASKGTFFLKDELLPRILIDKDLVERVLERRACRIDDESFDKITKSVKSSPGEKTAEVDTNESV